MSMVRPTLWRVAWYSDDPSPEERELRRGYVIARHEKEALELAEDEAFEVVCYPADSYEQPEPFAYPMTKADTNKIYNRIMARKAKLREQMDDAEMLLIKLEAL